MHKTKLVIVDDHQMVIDGIKNLVAQIPVIEVMDTFSDANQAYDFTVQNQVDVVLLDVSMPGLGGVEFVTKLKKAGVASKFVVMTMHNDPKTIRSMVVDLKVDAYVLKSAEYGVLKSAIIAVINGDTYYDDEVINVLNSKRVTAESEGQKISLSKRELSVLELMSEGLSTEEIAKKLFISKHTVNSHRKNLSFKFDTSRPIELVAKAKELGLV